MNSDRIFFEESPLEKANQLQENLVARATGGHFDGGDPAYKKLRQFFMKRSDTRTILPGFVERCRSLDHFWDFIKRERAQYSERRILIRDAFTALIRYLEESQISEAGGPLASNLEGFDSDHVRETWRKAQDRCASDPEGAITAARTLIEAVCKHILDDAGVDYKGTTDFPKLWNLTARQINLAPDQHNEEVFKKILGNCQSIVDNLAAIRNRVSDAHGRGRRPVRPKPRHAALSVNLAGSMAEFLIATWQERNTQHELVTGDTVDRN